MVGTITVAHMTATEMSKVLLCAEYDIRFSGQQATKVHHLRLLDMTQVFPSLMFYLFIYFHFFGGGWGLRGKE